MSTPAETDADLSDIEAERATEQMREHLERAKDIVEQYRNILTDVPNGSGDRRH